MRTPPAPDLDRSRTAWLTGDADAWARYLACVRQLASPADRPRQTRRPRRPRRRT